MYAFKAKVTAATLNEQAYVNANELIKLIAAELQNGYILNVAAATTALDTVIGRHNLFLGATVVQEAGKIKQIIKNIGLQTAAVGVGKGAAQACDNRRIN